MSSVTSPPVSIIIIGPESTGKTYLFERLIKSLSIPVSRTIPEVARALMLSKSWKGIETEMLERQEMIVDFTSNAEEEMMRRIQEVNVDHAGGENGLERNGRVEEVSSKISMISDRAGLCCLVYARLLQEERDQLSTTSSTTILLPSQPSNDSSVNTNSIQSHLRNELKSRNAINRYKNSLIILLEPVEIFLEFDGLRRNSKGGLKGWWYTFEIYLNVLDEFGIEYKRIGEDILDVDKRVEKVLEWVELRR